MTEHDETDPSASIDATIADIGDWQGGRLAQVRTLIHEAVPGVVEEVTWRWCDRLLRSVRARSHGNSVGHRGEAATPSTAIATKRRPSFDIPIVVTT